MKLPLLFSEAFDAPIWEMHLNDNFLLISTRDQEKKEVSFHLFDSNKGGFVWKDVVFEEAWLIGVTHFHKSMVVFHTFANSQDLEQKSIFGFNWKQQEVVWALDDFNPVHVVTEHLFCKGSNQQGNIFFKVNIADGDAVPVDNLPTGEKIKDDPLVSKTTFNPLHYVDGSEAFSSVAKFIKLKQNIEIYGACDYLEFKNQIVISYFEDGKQGKVNSLVIFNQDLEPIDLYVLDSELEGLASDTFFILNEALIFVRNRSQIVGLLIGTR